MSTRTVVDELDEVITRAHRGGVSEWYMIGLLAGAIKHGWTRGIVVELLEKEIARTPVKIPAQVAKGGKHRA